MRVEVKTRRGVRIHISFAEVVQQTKVFHNCGDYFEVLLKSGVKLELSNCLGELPLKERDERQKPSPLSTNTEKTVQTYAQKLEAKNLESVKNTGYVPTGKSIEALTKVEGKYRGEMVWTHKTSPEIAIFKDGGTPVKDIDFTSMYRRRD